MEAEEMLKRARIQIQGKNSFFAYLSLYLKFREKKELPVLAGVDVKGNFYYNPKEIEKLNQKELEGLVVHEIMHLSLLHFLRQGARDHYIFNLANDIVVNQLLKDNRFSLPEGGIISDSNNVVEIGGVRIEDCNKKTSEQVYHELMKQAKKVKIVLGKDGCGDGLRFDEHIEGDGEDLNSKDGKGKPLSSSKKKELERLWGERTQQALTISQMRGDTPKGMGRLVGELHKEKINWRALLQQYITQQIPYNYSYAKSHKKSRSMGYYMPHMTKEKIDISIMIDLSGSIAEKELTDFLSEICGMARAYQERITMRIFSHDVECYDNGEVRNGNIEKIKKMELKGGGGTSFSRPLEYLKENNIVPKCMIWLTDGYGDEIENPPFPICWVLSDGGSDNLLKGKGQVIKLEKF